MPPTTDLDNPSSKEIDTISLPQEDFQDLLKAARNADGGWGYHPESQSNVEATAWSILALAPHEPAGSGTVSSGVAWLRRAQTAEGAWPTSAGKEPGCWVTALACLALLTASGPSDQAVVRGLKWLCETWPAEGKLLWRMRMRWQRKTATVVRQNHSLLGWGWTPDTASWVEPTAYALILLQNVPRELYPDQAAERFRLGEKMLYDRACPGGGWNAGNPLVYGIPGVPRTGPTVWALLALRHHREHARNREGIDWLERSYAGIRSPGSLALAHLCLKAYGLTAPPIGPELCRFYDHNQFLQSIPVVAWALLALGDVPRWLECASGA